VSWWFDRSLQCDPASFDELRTRKSVRGLY
jgi:hypothetical protein